MNTLRATECMNPKPKTSKITTTLYDLLDEINSKFPGPQYTSEEPIQDDTYDPATLAVKAMFEKGQIKFQNLQRVKACFNEAYN